MSEPRVRVSSTSSTTAEFFKELAARGHEPLLKRASGTVRFDLVDDHGIDHWHVTMRSGDVSVARKNEHADCVVRLDRKTFEGMATGRINAMAAALRGDLVPDGDLGLVILFQRLFPAPPAATKGGHGARASTSV